jgi:hypothetical protein
MVLPARMQTPRWLAAQGVTGCAQLALLQVLADCCQQLPLLPCQLFACVCWLDGKWVWHLLCTSLRLTA